MVARFILWYVTTISILSSLASYFKRRWFSDQSPNKNIFYSALHVYPIIFLILSILFLMLFRVSPNLFLCTISSIVIFDHCSWFVFVTHYVHLVGWLINSPSTRCRLGYHEVWIRSPPILPRIKELLLLYYVKLYIISVYSSGSFTMSWSHHLTIWIIPGICSDSAQSS